MNRLQRFTYNSPQHVLWPFALAAFVVLCVLMAGCTSPLTQSTRSEQASQHQASTGSSQAAVDIVDKTVTQPKPVPAPPAVGTLTVSGENNKVEVTSPPPVQPTATAPDVRDTRVGVNSKSKGSTSDDWLASFDSATSLTIIGTAVGAILLALGGYALFRLFKYIRTQSAAANAGWEWADDWFANKIQSLRTKAATSTDPVEMAKALAEIAELERSRGIAASE